MTLLGLVVMRINLQPETDLLQHGVGLITARVARLHSRLVLELPEVHELADRGTSVRGNLDQVEIRLLRETQRVLDANDADLLTVRADQTYLRHADPLVDSGLADVMLLDDS